jgi:ribulose-phosphate 3-epimerase
MIKVSASVLGEGFSQEAVDSVKTADMLQLDILDGRFTPETSVWADIVDLLKTDLPKDVHLMTMNPEEHIQEFIDAGAARIAFHIEGTEFPESAIGQIQGAGLKAGIAIKPETPVRRIEEYLEMIDYVLIMTIHPGASGRKFMPEVLEKVRYIHAMYPHVEIEVDGGINAETGKMAADMGADILVSDSFIHNGNTEENIEILKNV